MSAEIKQFIKATVAQFVLMILSLDPSYLPASLEFLPFSHIPDWLRQAFQAGWLFSCAWVIVASFELFVWRRLFGIAVPGVPRQRKLLTDLFGFMVYVGALAVVTIVVFDQPVTNIFATSGVVAIVLALALQNTLGDLFAGLALNIERPFKAGQWISIGPDIQGMVLLTNWRATHIRTRTNDEMIIPNSVIVKANIINHFVPTRAHFANIEIPMIYGFDGKKVEKMLHDVALTVNHVMSDPPPLPLIHEMRPQWVVWRLYFWTEAFNILVALRGHVFLAVHEKLREEGYAEFLPKHHIYRHDMDKDPVLVIHPSSPGEADQNPSG